MDERTMYSNAVAVNAQFYDIQLTFTYQSSDGPKAQETIILSPQHFKVLTGIMNNALENYEQNFGTIMLPVETKSGE